MPISWKDESKLAINKIGGEFSGTFKLQISPKYERKLSSNVIGIETTLAKFSIIFITFYKRQTNLTTKSRILVILKGYLKGEDYPDEYIFVGNHRYTVKICFVF